MKDFKLELSDETYHRLKIKFQGDEIAIRNFINEVLSNALAEPPTDKNVMVSKKKNPDLNDYLKSEKPGSRSYGIKGQGW